MTLVTSDNQETFHSEISIDEIEAIKGEVMSLDLNRIIGKVAKDENITLDEVSIIAVQYKHFICLAGIYGNVAPTPTIDLFWHAHILDTISYDSFCQKVFGYKIHHVPTYLNQEFGVDNADSEEQKRLRSRTAKLFEYEFGYNPFVDTTFTSFGSDTKGDCKNRKSKLTVGGCSGGGTDYGGECKCCQGDNFCSGEK